MISPQRIDDYILEKVIGHGATCQVFQAYKLGNESKKFAVKLINEDSMSTREYNAGQLLNEAMILQKVHHKNIVNLHLCEPDGVLKIQELEFKELYTVMELAEKGVLIDYLIYTGSFLEEIARFYFLQLIEGIKHLHSKGFVHRDIKTENLLLNSEFNLLIADFGHCSQLKNGSAEMDSIDSNWRGIGTAKFNPPEANSKIIRDSPAVDIFMAGVVLFIMLFGEAPFKKGAVNDDTHYKFFFEGNQKRFWTSHSQITRGLGSESFIDLINSMFIVEPSQRITITEIEAHPWCKGTIPTKESISLEMHNRLERVKKIQKSENSK